MYAKIRNTAFSLVIILTLSFWVISIGEHRVNERKDQQGQEEEIKTIEVWYSTSLYEPYLAAAAEAFEKENNVAVNLKSVEGLAYISTIQSANMNMEGPDLCLTDSRYLQNFVRIGAAARTEQDEDYSEKLFYNNVWKNMEYQGNIYGYPLGFDTTVLMYNGNFVSEVLDSFEKIMDFSLENENIPAGEILRWSTEDFMYNYCFVGKYALIGGENGYEQTVNLNNQELFEAGAVYQKLCEYFTEHQEYSYDEVKNQFAAGKLWYAIVSTDVLKLCGGWETRTGFAVLPALNDDLQTSAVSVTDLAIVNEFSDEKEAASQFAKYLSAGMADRMYELCGVLPLAKSETVPGESRVFYEQYEHSQSLPKLMSTSDYWNKMRDALTKIRNGAEVVPVFEELHQLMEDRIKQQN